MLCWLVWYFRYYSYSRNPTGWEFFDPARTLIAVKLLNGSFTTFVNTIGLVCSFDCRNSTTPEGEICPQAKSTLTCCVSKRIQQHQTNAVYIMMLAHATTILSSFANRTVSGICGVCIGRGRGHGDMIVVAAAAFPARKSMGQRISTVGISAPWGCCSGPYPPSPPQRCPPMLAGGATSNEGVSGDATANPLLHQRRRGALWRDHDHAGQQA